MLIKLAGIKPSQKAGDLSPKQLKLLLGQMKSYEAIVMSVNPFANAQVCCGGVDTREVDAATMESGIHANLYLAGELLDVDGICGGYNLQFAWSSGMIAGYMRREDILRRHMRRTETGRRHMEHMALPQGERGTENDSYQSVKDAAGTRQGGTFGEGCQGAARSVRRDREAYHRQAVCGRQKKPDIWYSYVVDIGIRQAGLQKEEKLARS